MTKLNKRLLRWRAKQKRGAIMKPSTFDKIVRKAMKKYGIRRKRALKVAGKAYWKTAKSKYKRRKKKSNKYKDFLK